ncbi:MAG: hypothetical protein ACOC56_04350 [Atribacterota bacterium]
MDYTKLFKLQKIPKSQSYELRRSFKNERKKYTEIENMDIFDLGEKYYGAIIQYSKHSEKTNPFYIHDPDISINKSNYTVALKHKREADLFNDISFDSFYEEFDDKIKEKLYKDYTTYKEAYEVLQEIYFVLFMNDIIKTSQEMTELSNKVSSLESTVKNIQEKENSSHTVQICRGNITHYTISDSCYKSVRIKGIDSFGIQEIKAKIKNIFIDHTKTLLDDSLLDNQDSPIPCTVYIDWQGLSLVVTKDFCLEVDIETRNGETQA